MNKRRKIVFKVNGKVIVEENRDLTIGDINETLFNIADTIMCNVKDIKWEYVDFDQDLSTVDVGSDGSLFDWTDVEYRNITGVKELLEEGTDEWLDAVLTEDVDKLLGFKLEYPNNNFGSLE